jgi:hypothetical protein
MNFQTFTSGGRTFTAQEQAEAWDRYIEQDSYLSKNRGRYAERNAAFLPMRWQTDFSVSQEIFRNVAGRMNRLSIRLDVLNALNLLNSDWGVGQTFVNPAPLTNPSVDDQGRLQYRLRVVDGELMSNSYRPTAGLGDVYRVELGLRYNFNH